MDQIQFPLNTGKRGCVNPPPSRHTHKLPGASTRPLSSPPRSYSEGTLSFQSIFFLFRQLSFRSHSSSFLVQFFFIPRGPVIAPPAAVCRVDMGGGMGWRWVGCLYQRPSSCWCCQDTVVLCDIGLKAGWLTMMVMRIMMMMILIKATVLLNITMVIIKKYQHYYYYYYYYY